MKYYVVTDKGVMYTDSHDEALEFLRGTREGTIYQQQEEV